MKAVAALMLMAAVVFAAGCSKSDDPNDEGNNNGGNQSNHEYVDLGLPSGTLWATCNVGATSPEGYGDYFAWGETEPKATYDWSTYIYSKGDYNQLTKYCSKSDYGYNGFTDNLTILHSSDDAATVRWGNEWRTPTSMQWRELLENTNGGWTTQNDVYGRVFYGNGHSLFIPSAGYRYGDELLEAGGNNGGYYWSSTLCTGYPCWAYRLWRGVVIDSDGGRCVGQPIRAVRSAK